MTPVDQRPRPPHAAPPTGSRPTRTPLLGGRIGSVEVLAALLIALLVFREPLAAAISTPLLQTWTTVFVSVMVQATPFLVFGVALSAVIAVFVLTTPVFGVLLVLPSETANQLAGLASPMMLVASLGMWASGDENLAPPIGPYGPVYLAVGVALVAACVTLLLLRYRKVAAK